MKKGHVGYNPKDKDDFLECQIEFWTDGWETPPSKINVKANHTIHTIKHYNGEHDCPDDERPELPDDAGEIRYGVMVTYTHADTVENKRIRGMTVTHFSPYPEEWGRGEHEAKTLDDAKQMAIDFAEAVS